MANKVNKRVMKDIVEGKESLLKENGIYISPEEENYYNIHFILTGPEDTPYDGGLYHGLLRLSNEHPKSPPRIFFFTPSGRFVTYKYPVSVNDGGICASFTAYHPESWTSTYTIDTILKGFLSFMCDDKDTSHIGADVKPVEVRRSLAAASLSEILKDKIVQQLFPELCKDITCGTYEPIKLSNIKVVHQKTAKDLKRDEFLKSSDSEGDEVVVEKSKKVLSKKDSKKKKSKKQESESESEEDFRKKKSKDKKKNKSSKKLQDSDEESESESEEDTKKKSKHDNKKKSKR